MRRVNLIVAATHNWGIGRRGDLPFRLRGDMQHFKRVTTTTPPNKKNVVIMGRLTWESLPASFKPLPSRFNVVVSEKLTQDGVPDDVLISKSLSDAIKTFDNSTEIHEIFIIGGERLYKEALELEIVDKVFLTRVALNIDDCDRYLRGLESSINGNNNEAPFVPIAVSPTQVENDISYDFTIYASRNFYKKLNESENAPNASDKLYDTLGFALLDNKKKNQLDGRIQYPKAIPTIFNEKLRAHQEFQYLDLIHRVVSEGVARGDRTGTGTYSIFGACMRYDLSNGSFPLLTTKKTFLRGIAEELFWFFKGDTSQKRLADKKVYIWDANATRAFLDARGLHDRPEGDLGPVYGFQWRRFGAPYKGCDFNYDDWTPDASLGETRGVDQLAECIELIKNDPNSRRIIMTAWNPKDLPEMALPPCHMFCQFYVANGRLSCCLYQRSADLGLGVPFNIASYALMVRMLAQVTNLEAGEFVHMIGDAHVYSNHVEPLMKEQLNDRMPKPFPVLKLNPEKKSIQDFEWSDVQVTGYFPHEPVKMAMAV